MKNVASQGVQAETPRRKGDSPDLGASLGHDGSSSVPMSWLLAVLAGGVWIMGHAFNDFSLPFTAMFVALGATLGVVSPGIAAGLTLALVPFAGGDVNQGLAELARSVPLLAAAARVVADRVRGADDAKDVALPSRFMLLAAVTAMFLYPAIRLTANGAPWAPPQTAVDDILFLIGAPSAMFAGWIVFSHLPQLVVNRLLQVLPVTLLLAMLAAIAAWLGVPMVDRFTFDGEVYGRLAGLGFPTPTAMGVAIALPLAVAGALRVSRVLAGTIALVGLVTIVLTESRGPMIAILLAGAIMMLMGKRLSWRWYVAALILVICAVTGLVALRYPELLSGGSTGGIPDLEGDSLRIVSWVAGVQIALQEPLTGGGWMSVRGWNDGELGEKNVNLSHNLLLQGFADGGIPLGVAISIVVIGSLRAAWVARSNLPPAWIAALVALLVCGAWDMPQLRAFAAVMGGLALGLVCRTDLTRQTER